MRNVMDQKMAGENLSFNNMNNNWVMTLFTAL